METIQIEVSPELARRLRPYQSELPRILEWGLRQVEGESEAMAQQKRIVAVLRQAGAVGPDPEEVAQYVAGCENQRWTPVEAGGKSASDMIIEERDSRPWTRR